MPFPTHKQLVGRALHLQRLITDRRRVHGLGNEVKIIGLKFRAIDSRT